MQGVKDKGFSKFTVNQTDREGKCARKLCFGDAFVYSLLDRLNCRGEAFRCVKSRISLSFIQ
jgi:hypothetical protein